MPRVFKQNRIIYPNQLPHSIYNKFIINKFISLLMTHGEKAVAEKILYGTFSYIRRKYKKNPLKVLKKALKIAKPLIHLKSTKRRGRIFLIPRTMKLQRQMFLAIKWLIQVSRARSEKTMVKKLALELIATIKKKGNVLKIKKELYKTAQSNRAFIHFRIK